MVVVIFFIMMAGLFGIIIPTLPSFSLILGGVLLYTLFIGIAEINFDFLAVITALCLIAVLLDFLATKGGKFHYHSSVFGIAGSVIGGLTLSFLKIPGGLFWGALIGAIIGEIIAGKEAIFVYKTKRTRVIGFLGGALLKITIGVMVIIMFIQQFWANFIK